MGAGWERRDDTLTEGIEGRDRFWRHLEGRLDRSYYEKFQEFLAQEIKRERGRLKV